MIEKFSLLANKASNLLRKQTGAVAFEYVLIIGGVSAVIVGAMVVAVPGLFNDVFDASCDAIVGVLDDAGCEDDRWDRFRRWLRDLFS